MSQMRDLPPISGAIIWARQIDWQLQTYMKRVENVLGKGWELYAEGQKLQSESQAFRKKLEKEKASIDTRLKSGVKEQLDATREGLKKLLGTRANVQAIKDEMSTVDGLCKNPANVISTFDQISRVRFTSLSVPIMSPNCVY